MTVPPQAVRLLRKAGFGQPLSYELLSGGANNRVLRVDTESGSVVLKIYFRDEQDGWDRGAAEWSFLQFAWRNGVRAVPQPLAQDAQNGLALYEYVSGRRPERTEVDQHAVDDALAFFAALNARSEDAQLGHAAEACFSIADHVNTIDRRIERLRNLEGNDEARLAKEFVTVELLPVWKRVRDEIDRAGCADALPPNLRCVSPSDFGFHNALRKADGTMCFLDFEYAGWDDPAKLVGDFFNQVAVPVPLEYIDAFVDAVSKTLGDRTGSIAGRATLLLPAYTIKWCCILLNEFLPAGGARRRHAGNAFERQPLSQLAKARELLGRLPLPT